MRTSGKLLWVKSNALRQRNGKVKAEWTLTQQTHRKERGAAEAEVVSIASQHVQSADVHYTSSLSRIYFLRKRQLQGIMALFEQLQI